MTAVDILIAAIDVIDADRDEATDSYHHACAVLAKALTQPTEEKPMGILISIPSNHLPTDTDGRYADAMDRAVAAVAAESSPEHASRLRAAWADLSDAINSSAVEHRRYAVAIDKIDTATDEHRPEASPFRDVVYGAIGYARGEGEAPRLVSDMPMASALKVAEIETATDPNPPRDPLSASDLANGVEEAWGIIANASGGNWSRESPEWQDAAVRWRDRYITRRAPDRQK